MVHFIYTIFRYYHENSTSYCALIDGGLFILVNSFELLLPSFQHEAIRPVMSDINKAISPRQLLLTGYLPFIQTILCQP